MAEHQFPVIIIKPTSGWAPLNLGQLWDYRELITFFAIRDIALRYRQTYAGVGWAVIQPVMMMIIFTILFGRMAKFDSEGIPYSLFCFVALLPWQYVSTTITAGSMSLVNNPHLISKVYFPRMVIPIAASLPPFLDLGVSCVVLALLMIFHGKALGPNSLYLPSFLLLMFTSAMGPVLWLGAMNVQYRDVKYVIAFLLQTWMFTTPIMYSSHVVPEQYRWLLALNPLATVIDGFRWCIFGAGDLSLFQVIISTVVSLLLLVSGAIYFRTMEKSFADKV